MSDITVVIALLTKRPIKQQQDDTGKVLKSSTFTYRSEVKAWPVAMC